MSRNVNITIAIIVAMAMVAVPAIAALDSTSHPADGAQYPNSGGVFQILYTGNDTGDVILANNYDAGWGIGPGVGSLEGISGDYQTKYNGNNVSAYTEYGELEEPKTVDAYLTKGTHNKVTLTSSYTGEGLVRLLTVNERCTLYLEDITLDRGGCKAAMVNVLGDLVIGSGVVFSKGNEGNNVSLMTTGEGTITIAASNVEILGGIGSSRATGSSGVVIEGDDVKIDGDIAGQVTIKGDRAVITGDVKKAIVEGSGAVIKGSVANAEILDGGSLTVEKNEFEDSVLTVNGGNVSFKGDVDTLNVNGGNVSFKGDVDTLNVNAGNVAFTGNVVSLHLNGGTAQVEGTIGTVSVTGASELNSIASPIVGCKVTGGITVDIAGDGEFVLGKVTVDTNKTSRGMTVDEGDVRMLEGCIFQNNAVTDADGGAILLCDGATLVMQGGTITGNTAATEKVDRGNGGAVAVYKGATFTMEGGTISDNKAIVPSQVKNSGNGGAVYVAGTFTMEGGTISGNQALNGGAVRVNSEKGEASFTMEGGVITGNQAGDNGGAVSVRFYNNDAKFIMEGGDITENRAGLDNGGAAIANDDQGYGGAVHMFDAELNRLDIEHGSIMEFNGGTISDNTALRGGDAIVLKDNASSLRLGAGEFGDNGKILISNDISNETAATIVVYNTFEGEVDVFNKAGDFTLIGTGSDKDSEPRVMKTLDGTTTGSVDASQPDAGRTFVVGTPIVEPSTTQQIFGPTGAAQQVQNAPEEEEEDVEGLPAAPFFTFTIDGVERDVALGASLKVGDGTPTREGMTLVGWNVGGELVSVDNTIFIMEDTTVTSVWTESSQVETQEEEAGLGTESSAIGGMDGIVKMVLMVLLIFGGLYVVKRELA